MRTGLCVVEVTSIGESTILLCVLVCVLLRLLVLVSLLSYCAYLSMCVVEVTSIGEPTILLCIPVHVCCCGY